VGQYWIVAESMRDGMPVLIRLATFPKDVGIDIARKVFEATVQNGSYYKAYLVEVLEEV